MSAPLKLSAFVREVVFLLRAGAGGLTGATAAADPGDLEATAAGLSEVESRFGAGGEEETELRNHQKKTFFFKIKNIKKSVKTKLHI